MILITGASGFVGTHLVKRLVETGKKIRCFDTVFSKRPPASFQFVHGNLMDINSVNLAMEDIDLIIHLAAVHKPNAASKINVIGIQNLLSCALKKKVKKFIFISSTDAMFRETVYGISKFEAENIVRNSGMKFVILRPSIIYGKQDKVISKLINIIRYSPIIPIIKRQDYKLQPVYIEDVVLAIISAMDTEKAENKTYTIAGPEPIALKEIINQICQILSVRRKIIYISESCINLVKFFLRPFEKRIPVFYFLFGYGKERIYDIQSAARDLAYKPITFQKGLSLSLENK